MIPFLLNKTVYVIEFDKVYEDRITSIEQNVKEWKYPNGESTAYELSDFDVFPEDFGDIVFLTKIAASKKLRADSLGENFYGSLFYYLERALFKLANNLLKP